MLMTISSYMIVELDDELDYLHDHNIFLHDRTESVFKLRNIKNQCVDLFSSLIECFGDLAVQSILQIIHSLLGQKDANRVKQEGAGAGKEQSDA